jgi:hypothetical protein
MLSDASAGTLVVPTPSPDRRFRRLAAGSAAWAWFLGVTLAGVGAYYLVPEGIPRDLVYVAFGLAAVVAIEAGVRLNRPTSTRPWRLLALGTLLWSTGDLLGAWYADVEGLGTFPTAADPVYLLGYVAIGAGLVLLIRARGPRRDPAALLDSAIVTVALGLLGWVLLAEPTIDGYRDAPLAATVAVTYPLFDILLVSLLIRLVTGAAGPSGCSSPRRVCWPSPTPSSPR